MRGRCVHQLNMCSFCITVGNAGASLVTGCMALMCTYCAVLSFILKLHSAVPRDHKKLILFLIHPPSLCPLTFHY
jgi:hypothetical protein